MNARSSSLLGVPLRIVPPSATSSTGGPLTEEYITHLPQTIPERTGQRVISSAIELLNFTGDEMGTEVLRKLILSNAC